MTIWSWIDFALNTNANSYFWGPKFDGCFTKGWTFWYFEYKFFKIIPCCCDCGSSDFHIIIQNKMNLWIKDQTLKPTSCEFIFLSNWCQQSRNGVNIWTTSNHILIINKNNFASNWNGEIIFIGNSSSSLSLVNFTQRLIAFASASFINPKPWR